MSTGNCPRPCFRSKLKNEMRTRQINVVSGVVHIVLSLTALLTVMTGLLWPPRLANPDEGTQAHIFQLSIAALLPMTMLVIATADWRLPWRSARPLIISSVAMVLAFGGLYYLEHFR